MKVLHLIKRIFIGVSLISGGFYAVINSPLCTMLVAIAATSCGVMEMVLIRTRMIDILNTEDEVEKKEVKMLPQIFQRSGSEFLQILIRMMLAGFFPIVTLFNDPMTLIMYYSVFVLLFLNVGSMFGFLNYNGVSKGSHLDLRDFIAAQIDYFSIMYLGLSFTFGILSGQRKGFEWIPIYLSGLVALSDACGLFAGKFLGQKNKATGRPRFPLHSILSPNKTIEGALGSIIGCALAGYIFIPLTSFWNFSGHKFIFPGDLFFIIGGTIVGFLAVLGDLLESYIKRVARVKDSGNMLGAHGGMLDRLDATYFTLPIAYLLFCRSGFIDWFL